MLLLAIERAITLPSLYSTLAAAPSGSSSNWYILSYFPVTAS